MYKMRDEGLFEIIISDFQEPVDYSFEVTLYNQWVKTNVICQAIVYFMV